MSQRRYYADNSVDINEPNLIIDIIHDKLGRRERIDVNDVDNDTLGKWRWWYDGQGRVTAILALDHFVAYEYHGNTGRRKSVRTPQVSADTKVNYYYDELGRLGEVNVAKRNNVTVDESTCYGYNAVGSLAIVDYNNGNLAEYTYDTLNRLTNLTNWQTASKLTALSSYTYELAPDGQRLSATEVTEGAETVINWTYDALNRLISEDYNAPGDANDYEHQYVYDLVGNRLERIVAGDGNDTFYYYNDNDQLTLEFTDANTNCTYDENGSLISEANDSETLRTYTYNYQNRLASFDDGLVTVDYLYNPDGMRVRATVDGNDIDYIIDPHNHTGYTQVLKEINGVTGDNTVYITGHDILAQAVGTANPNYLLYDGHGSTRQLANNVGNVVANYHYDAYGQALNFNPATAATQLLYCGEMIDQQTAWYNNRARWYNPATGRFNRTDPFAGTNHDPQSLHKYLYCHANPVDYVDPMGLFTGNFGYVAEDAIQLVYALDHPGDNVAYGRWTRLPGVFRLRPDIFNMTRKTWLEIKPLSVSGVAKAGVSVAKYLVPLGVFGYKPEISWEPSTHYMVAGTVPIFFFNAGGIVFYTDVLDNLEDLAALSSVAAVRQFLMSAAGQRFMQSTIGVFGRVPGLVRARLTIDYQRMKGHLTISGLFSTLGVL
ncbi:MAG: RHS repeat domain-containing protein [Planctomycetota bacterium]